MCSDFEVGDVVAFKADPSSIDAFGAVLGGLGDDVVAAKEYPHKHLSYDYGDARLFFTIANADNDAKSAVSGSLDQLMNVVAKSAEEPRKTAAVYRGTDDEEEKRLDSTYPSK